MKRFFELKNRLSETLEYLDIGGGMVLLVIALTVLLAVAEGFGLGMILPILVFVEDGAESFGQSPLGAIKTVADIIEYLGLPLTLPALLGLAVTLLVLRQLIAYSQECSSAWIQVHGVLALRERAITALIRASPKFFVEQRHGQIINAVFGETGPAGKAAYQMITLLLYGLFCLLYLVILLISSWQLALISLCLLPVLAFVVRYFIRIGKSLSVETALQNANFNESLSDVIRGMNIIRMRAAEDKFRINLSQTVQTIGRVMFSYRRSQAGLEAIGPLILAFIIFFVLFIAVDMLNLSLANLGLFMVISLRFQQALNKWNSTRLNLTQDIVTIDRVKRFIHAAENHPAPTGSAEPFVGIGRGIRFENLAYSYRRSEQEVPVLRGLSFSIASGQSVALVGHSGAGKTTLIELLVRNIIPKSGDIIIDGKSISGFDLGSYRKKIGVVPQHTYFFHNTIRNNLTVGLSASLTDEAIWDCLHKSYAGAFVRDLPDGLDTMLGEEGHDLSGGQRQRLSLARALCQNPEILILDEPTSSLDAISERSIQMALNKLQGSLTILTIAHRLSTIQNADRIIVLKEGVIAGQGTHDSLLRGNETYNELFRVAEV